MQLQHINDVLNERGWHSFMLIKVPVTNHELLINGQKVPVRTTHIHRGGQSVSPSKIKFWKYGCIFFRKEVLI